jgi:SWIM zinc finger
MEAAATGRTSDNAGESPLVMVRSEDGFRVYSPANPGRSYTVSGGPEHPTCTCPEFRHGKAGEYCAHIAAVLNAFGRGNGAGEEDRYAREERAAIQSEGHATPAAERESGPAVMLIKRSVSPDGRIDSLSVEFSTEVDGAAAGEVTARAGRLLALQSAIVGSFLDGAKNGNGTRPAPERHDETNGAALAEMVSIGGMDGKWGRRLFIAIQANGQSLRLFGNRGQLAEAIRTAGFPRLAERIEEGVVLRVPCRVMTKPSPDGKYLNIERLLPVRVPENGRDGR